MFRWGFKLQTSKSGCLAFLFGFGGSNPAKPADGKNDDGEHEGNIHSGPGGYEGMSYEGGYAADYLNHDGDHDHDH